MNQIQLNGGMEVTHAVAHILSLPLTNIEKAQQISELYKVIKPSNIDLIPNLMKMLESFEQK